jgi:hypothetical protein
MWTTVPHLGGQLVDLVFWVSIFSFMYFGFTVFLYFLILPVVTFVVAAASMFSNLWNGIRSDLRRGNCLIYSQAFVRKAHCWRSERGHAYLALLLSFFHSSSHGSLLVSDVALAAGDHRIPKIDGRRSHKESVLAECWRGLYEPFYTLMADIVVAHPASAAFLTFFDTPYNFLHTESSERKTINYHWDCNQPPSDSWLCWCTG